MIIFINGSINSGKSTISKLLAQELGNAAVLEIDQLRAFFDWMPLDQAIPINLSGACLLIRNFVEHNINVVVPYPLSNDNYEYIVNTLYDLKKEIKVVTLNPQLETVVVNRGNRKLTVNEVKRIKYHYATGINSPSFGVIVDNTNQTPESTVEEIMTLIGRNPGSA